MHDDSAQLAKVQVRDKHQAAEEQFVEEPVEEQSVDTRTATEDSDPRSPVRASLRRFSLNDMKTRDVYRPLQFKYIGQSRIRVTSLLTSAT